MKTQKEALFEAVLDNVTDAIIVIDKDLKVIFQNEAVHRRYGSKLGERCFEAYRWRQEPCDNCIILRKAVFSLLGTVSPGGKSQGFSVSRPSRSTLMTRPPINSTSGS